MRRWSPGFRAPGRRVVRALTAAGAAALLGVVPACSGGSGSTGSPGQPATSTPEAGWDRSPSSVAAVGDSITRGFDACSVLQDCPEVSWSTGTDPEVHSLAQRLLGAGGVKGHSWNFARSGSRAAELSAQMEKAAKHRPALVTVLMGANDACRPSVDSMTPVDAYRTQVETALRTLREKSPTTEVYVSSVPDLKRLWSEGRTNPLGKEVWKLGICASMLSAPDAVDSAATERRDAVQKRVVAYNEALREVCVRERMCRYDDGEVFAYRFGGSQLSQWDWFHPSRDGQSKLAEIAYRVVTARGAPGQD